MDLRDDETRGDDAPSDGADAGASVDDLRPVDPDHYTVEEPIGEGGLGRLVRAHDRRLGRTVAIKLMRRLSTRLEMRFRREAEITARLQHPGIVPIHEAGRWTSGEPYYAMKLISGSSLKQLIVEATTLETRLPLVHKLLGACEALGYAHSQRVIHRDVKSSNIMVGAFGETVVIDWGLAKVIGIDDDDDLGGDAASSDAAATVAGTIVGTPAYMPPEQARGDELDYRSDVYAVGVVLYELLAGRLPYAGDDARAVMRAVIERAPPPLASLARDMPRELVAIADKAMARTPADRYADAGELAADLRRFLDGQLVGAHRYSPWQRIRRTWRRHRAVVTVATASALALLGFGGYSVRRIVVERHAAEVARAQTDAERTDLLLAQARLWMDRDPTVALAWLKKYARANGADRDAIATLAADARARGAARARVLDRKRSVVAPDGRTFAAVSNDTLVGWTLDDATPRTIAKLDGPLGGLAYAADGTLVTAEGNHVRARPIGAPMRELLATPEPLVVLYRAGPAMIGGTEHGDLVWFDANGANARTLPTGGSVFTDLVASDDGRVVVTHQRVGGAHVWHREGASTDLAQISAHAAEVKHLALSRDGTHVAWGDDNGVVRVIALDGGAVQELRGHKGSVQRVAFSDDGTHVASTAPDSSVRVWDLATGTAQVLAGHTTWTQRVTFSPDGTQLASTALDRTIRIWDLATGDSQVLRGQAAPVSLIAFTHDGHDLVTGDSRGELRVWPVVRPTERVLHTPTPCATLELLPGNDLLGADDHGDQYIFAHGVTTPRTIAMPVGQSPVGVAEILGADGRTAIVASADGAIVIADLATGEIRTLPGTDGQIYELELAKDGKHVTSAGADHAIRRWDLATGAQTVVGRHERAVWHVASSPDESLLASAGDDLALRVWDRSGNARLLAGHTGLVYVMAFSPDGKVLASAGTDATVRVWNPLDGTARVFAGHTGQVQALAFSPDGRILATSGDDQTARLWDVATGTARVLDHGAGVPVLKFSPDGRWLATGGVDGSVRVWDVARASVRSVSRGNASTILAIAISADGRELSASAEDGSIHVWNDLATSHVFATAADLDALGTVELVDGDAVSR